MKRDTNENKKSISMDVLVFYAKSADKPAGKGKGDQVSDSSVYNDLNSIPNWRRIFSSLWSEEPFQWQLYSTKQILSFRSVEHALQAAKFASAGLIDTALRFTLESGGAPGIEPGLAAHQARKLVLLNAEQLGSWESIRRQIKDSIYLARYSNGIARRALLGTQNAELHNRGPRIQSIRCTSLEKVRAAIRSK